jgi:hypothetical protein
MIRKCDLITVLEAYFMICSQQYAVRCHMLPDTRIPMSKYCCWTCDGDFGLWESELSSVPCVRTGAKVKLYLSQEVHLEDLFDMAYRRYQHQCCKSMDSEAYVCVPNFGLHQVVMISSKDRYNR